jgi:hypothetical protein
MAGFVFRIADIRLQNFLTTTDLNLKSTIRNPKYRLRPLPRGGWKRMIG